MKPGPAAVQSCLDLDAPPTRSGREDLRPGVTLLRGFALPAVDMLREAILEVAANAAFRHLVTPGGHRMSVAMTNCGRVGWVSDRRGYRYDARDPATGMPWPAMPGCLRELARESAALAGFNDFAPNACLINRYATGAKMSLHQDRDENNADQPIVSVSLGVPAMFLLGGLERSDATRRLPLFHGDVLVWGGPARMVYHGVMPLQSGSHAFMGDLRINLTFRTAWRAQPAPLVRRMAQ